MLTYFKTGHYLLRQTWFPGLGSVFAFGPRIRRADAAVVACVAAAVVAQLALHVPKLTPFLLTATGGSVRHIVSLSVMVR